MSLAGGIVELALHGDTTLWQAAIGACLVSLAPATGAAVLRYRLYDIDRIISRTLAYGLLTVLLGSRYAGVVLGRGGSCPRTPAWWWPLRPWLGLRSPPEPRIPQLP